MKRQTFVHGALVLMAASLVTRIMGFVYRIFLTRLIGASGMGLFQLVFPLLNLVLTFVTAGLPIAISKLVAEAVAAGDRVRILRIIRVSYWVIGVLAVIFTAIMWFARHFILHHWLSDPRAYPSYLAMIPIVSIIAIATIYRGYFQGIQDMTPTAVASIIEQTVRILTIWGLAAYFIRFSLPFAAAAAMMGMVFGELSGLLYLIFQQKKRARINQILPNAPARSSETVRQTLRSLAAIAAPVTLSRLISSAIFALEPILVTRALLKAGMTTHAATSAYGEYSGMAIPLLLFPTVFTWSLATNLVPNVSEAIAGSNLRRVRVRLSQSFLATAIVGFPSSVMLALFATPLCASIYHQAEVGKILVVMAPAGFFLYLQAPLTGILQGLDHAGIAMRNSIIGGILRLGMIYFLARQPHLNIMGVAYAVTISIVVTTILHMISVGRRIGFPVRLESLLKTIFASLIIYGFLEIITKRTTTAVGGKLWLAIFAGFLLYFLLLCGMRVVTTDNVKRLPKIGQLLATIVSWVPFSI
ncbi:stage V sporulation protein B [Alicyclobacillus sp. TC]|uniref:stage V sporulation protein B n=1 Tax=Alicyclobacillus sp. TC TaxID=2606450 RepID=UPI001933BB6D|nr:stage V sporulation protein B [Alicyclobacillus sp. TC]QRF23023.1 stage V sporulation protein B [Alicyclobacillus sp. TC]